MNTDDGVPEVDAKTTYEQFQNGEVQLLDVRERSEWALGHIEGAALIPMSELNRRWRELDANSKWVCVCRSGHRSEYVTAVLRQAGLDIANLAGGMLDWQANNLPITPPGIVDSH